MVWPPLRFPLFDFHANEGGNSSQLVSNFCGIIDTNIDPRFLLEVSTSGQPNDMAQKVFHIAGLCFESLRLVKLLVSVKSPGLHIHFTLPDSQHLGGAGILMHRASCVTAVTAIYR
jgi:hypothetical protein